MEFINKLVQGWKEQRSRDRSSQKRQEEAVQALLSAGLTPQAKERISRQLSEGRSTFSSDLSVREYLLCRESGFETLGQVMGSSFYNISLFGVTGATLGTLTRSEYNPDKYISSTGAGLKKASGELAEITQAQLKARTLAVERMLAEAR